MAFFTLDGIHLIRVFHIACLSIDGLFYGSCNPLKDVKSQVPSSFQQFSS